MRELKFRAFDLENKTWTFVTLGDLICGACIKNGDKPLSGAKQVWEQYTGFKDKKGKEIYEGDVVSRYTSYYTETFEIAWREDKAGWFGFAADDYTSPLCNIGHVEVIGNVHENADLLEEEE